MKELGYYLRCFGMFIILLFIKVLADPFFIKYNISLDGAMIAYICLIWNKRIDKILGSK